MTYLLDVNALVALGVSNHEFHERVGRWIKAQRSPVLATCSITELGFARVVAQVPEYGFSVAQPRTLLNRLKEANRSGFTFLTDYRDISHLPNWVKTPKQITHGHLLSLAIAHGVTLATLDARIPSAYVIRAG